LARLARVVDASGGVAALHSVGAFVIAAQQVSSWVARAAMLRAIATTRSGGVRARLAASNVLLEVLAGWVEAAAADSQPSLLCNALEVTRGEARGQGRL
jgi:hypothetical protein